MIIGSEGKGIYGRRVIDYLVSIAYPHPNIKWTKEGKCDFIVRSQFYNRDLPWNKYKLPYINWSGERFLISNSNMALDTLHIATIFEENENYIYIPYVNINFDGNSNVRRYKSTGERKFAYCYTRPNKNREDFFTLLCQMAPSQTCYSLGGSHGHSRRVIKDKCEGSWISDGLIKEYSRYDFVIAFENSDNYGYITEKILNAFKSGAIPIYWGCQSITSLFNSKAFINIKDFKTYQECCNHILSLSNEQITLMKNQPVFPNNRVPDIMLIDKYPPVPYYQECANKLKKFLDKYISIEKTRNFITYGTGKFVQSRERICKEASKLFDIVKGYDLQDLDIEFRRKNAKILSNQKGGGFWLWKPYIVKHSLDKINQGDFLVYCDAGCKIIPENKHRLEEWFHMLNKSLYGIISFKLIHKEQQWTKKEVFKHFDFYTETPQLHATVLIIQKKPHSEHIINKWYDTMINNGELFTDIMGKQDNDFKQHRHDQSVLSIIRKLHGSIELEDETYYNKKSPILALRIGKK